jgi:hypothetical protein
MKGLMTAMAKGGHTPRRSASRESQSSTPADAVLALQRHAGNHAVDRLIAARGTAGPLPPPFRREMEARLGTDLQSVRVHDDAQAFAPETLPGRSSPLPARTPAALRPEPESEKTHERTMRQKQAGPATVAPTEAPAEVHDVLSSPGERLDAVTRALFEPRFGFDFSGVRVHRDAQAAKSARAVHARAYTVGDHVVFGDRQAIEHTQDGQATLAHELAHVIQQNRGGSERPALRGGALEQAAESAAAAFVGGQSSICVSGASAPGLARQPVPGGEEKKPRSLRESLKAGAQTDWALAEEIDLISEWLLVNPSSVAEYKQLSGELDRLEGEQWRRTQKAEKKQRRQEQIAKVEEAVEAGRIPKWLPVFPFLPGHGLGALMPWDLDFDAAPIMARREGESIVVQQPINSVKNTRRFAKDVRSIEHNVHGNVFSNQGGRLRPDDLVGVRLYDEDEKVVVVEARQLLEFARASDRALYVNIVATALSAASGAVAGKVAQSVATRSFVTQLAVNTATGTGLGFATAAGSSAIVDAGYLYSGDITAGQLFSNAWEAGKSGAKYGAAFSAAGQVLGAGVSRFSPNAKLRAQIRQHIQGQVPPTAPAATAPSAAKPSPAAPASAGPAADAPTTAASPRSTPTQSQPLVDEPEPVTPVPQGARADKTASDSLVQREMIASAQQRNLAKGLADRRTSPSYQPGGDPQAAFAQQQTPAALAPTGSGAVVVDAGQPPARSGALGTSAAGRRTEGGGSPVSGSAKSAPSTGGNLSNPRATGGGLGGKSGGGTGTGGGKDLVANRNVPPKPGPAKTNATAGNSGAIAGRGTQGAGAGSGVRLHDSIIKRYNLSPKEADLIQSIADEYVAQMAKRSDMLPHQASTKAHEAVQDIFTKSPEVTVEDPTGITSGAKSTANLKRSDLQISRQGTDKSEPSQWIGPVIELKRTAAINDQGTLVVKGADFGQPQGYVNEQVQAYHIMTQQQGIPVLVVNRQGDVFAPAASGPGWVKVGSVKGR